MMVNKKSLTLDFQNRDLEPGLRRKSQWMICFGLEYGLLVHEK